MLQTRHVLSVIGVLVVFLLNCGSDDKGSSSPCDGVCGCVQSAGGDRNQCNSQCQDVISAGGNQRAQCEARLDATGFSQCKSNCASFPAG